ncbi:carbohydrate ABC transporter permease [Lederbergia galactosidilytica]|uniref:Sugar ABC transporter permease n=1 Tax=Lederbergia galactosidilytica TaxID=217031 RepID=A0A178A5K3_9BACI|nr:sugar ABC transporter permease [Lederbergia galactosidilytica]OAK75486.1 sugar ABC transporter permease [Lederbergia galactosidilytica]
MKKNKTLVFKAMGFLLPFLSLYLLFTIYPMIKGLEMSFFKWNLIRKMEFVGLANYKRMLSDPGFWESVWNTTFFVVVSTPIYVIVALLLALICNVNSKMKTFYRGAFFLPYILSVSVISFLAIFIFKPYTGFINGLLHSIGLNWEPFWLAEPKLAWFSIIITTLWWSLGFNLILYLAALQEIDPSLYEAGKIDGASKLKLFWHVTVPMLGPITKVIVLLQVISSYKLFAQVWLVTEGGPGTTTRPIIQYIYEMGFIENNLGYAATMSYGVFAILLVLVMMQYRLTFHKER